MPQFPLYLIAFNLSMLNIGLLEIRNQLEMSNNLKSLKNKK